MRACIVDVPIDSTVYDLKTEIEDKIGLPRWVTILYTQMGKGLEDGEYLNMYAYNGELDAVVKRIDTTPRGGGNSKRQRRLDGACSKCGGMFKNTLALQAHWARCKIQPFSISASLILELNSNDDESMEDDEDDDGTVDDIHNVTPALRGDDWLTEYTERPPDPGTTGDEDEVYWNDALHIISKGRPDAEYEHLLSAACDDKTDLLVTNQLMDDLNFAELAHKCDLSRRDSQDVINFIKSAHTNLTELQHPRSTLVKAKKTFGEVEWRKTQISLNDGGTMGLSEDDWCIDIEYRPIGDAITEVLEAVGSRSTVKLRAESSIHGISEACQSAKFRRTQAFLFPDITDSDFPVQLILFIDDSHCDTQGNLVACPVMMTLANFTVETMVLDEAKTILMYIPVITSSIAEKGEGMSRIKRTINDRCLDIILEEVEATQEKPIALSPFNDDEIFFAKVAVHCIANDTKAANELLHHNQGWNSNRPCRICLILFNDLLKDPPTGAYRTTEQDSALRREGNKKKLKQYSIKGGYCPFAAHSRALGDTDGKGKFMMFPPEMLHQNDGGEQKVTRS